MKKNKKKKKREKSKTTTTTTTLFYRDSLDDDYTRDEKSSSSSTSLHESCVCVVTHPKSSRKNLFRVPILLALTFLLDFFGRTKQKTTQLFLSLPLSAAALFTRFAESLLLARGARLSLLFIRFTF